MASSLLSKIQLVGSLLFLLLALASADVKENSQHPIDNHDSSDESSQPCFDALWDEVACPHIFVRLYDIMGMNGYFEESDLEELCTDTCYASLLKHRAAVQEACPKDYLSSDKVTHGSVYEVPLLAEQGIFMWRFTCLKTSDGKWCNAMGRKENSDLRNGLSEDCLEGWHEVVKDVMIMKDEL